MPHYQQASFGHHICGCYIFSNHKRHYLPQCELKSHTTINPVCFTTRLQQCFHNPNDHTLTQARYTFPLYDGVAVSGYSITYGEQTLTGVVKQKDQARKTFQAAIRRGETAGLLESLPAGVFGVTLGNVPPHSDILVDILYCGELQHDAGVDGLRHNLPTSIAPRYGNYPGELMQSNTTNKGGIKITIDIDMGKSAIRKVQSPSHPISMSMGQLSTTTNERPIFSPAQASVSLTQGTTELAGDFVLQLLIDDINKPQAILENHPLLPNQRAIMATLVPRFVLESARPEIVFIADQSGSMSGSKNIALVSALKIFLKSIPLGVRFNICAFGSSFEFLWKESQPYSENHVNQALAFVDGLSASYGGTEILEPIKETFARHLRDLPLEVMLLTDGEIWHETELFDFINEQIRDKKVEARVFALGIGQDVSHTLVEGVARAGNGFAQFVTQNEEIDQKVIRTLKGSLYGHTREYELEVHYKTNDQEDDFEIVDRVKDCLIIEDRVGDATSPELKPKPKSFFDTSADPDAAVIQQTDRYAHLPPMDTPKVLQAPAEIAPLFPFNRTTAYLLLGPDSSQQDIASVTLRATSAQGPLELNIPVSGTENGASIHKLAARKAIQDLEEGRGWLQSAKTSDGILLKQKYKSRFDELVEREAVRLGERYQVAGKWTSFVAVEDKSQEVLEADQHEAQTEQIALFAGAVSAPKTQQSMQGGGLFSFSARNFSADASPFPSGSGTGFGRASPFGSAFGSATNAAVSQGSPFSAASYARPAPSGPSLFGNQNVLQQQSANRLQMAQSSGSHGHFGAAASQGPVMAEGEGNLSSFQGRPAAAAANNFLRAYYDDDASDDNMAFAAAVDGDVEEREEEADVDMGFGLFDDETPASRAAALPAVHIPTAAMQQYQEEMRDAACMPLPDEEDIEAISQPARAPQGRNAISKPETEREKLHRLIGLQHFDGHWERSVELLSMISCSESAFFTSGYDDDAAKATALVSTYLETKLSSAKDVWEMIVHKARAWLVSRKGAETDQVMAWAKQLLES